MTVTGSNSTTRVLFAAAAMVSLALGIAAGQQLALRLRATLVDSKEAPLRIELLRWSTDAERAPLMTALSTPPPAPPAAAPAPSAEPSAEGQGQGGRGGRGGGGRAGGATTPPAEPAAEAQGGRGGRGGDGRAGADGRAGGGGRGGAGRGGRGGDAATPAPPPSPTARLGTAVKAAPTVGYIWSEGPTGYSIKYAWHTAPATGPERIVLAIERRLGVHSTSWPQPTDAAAAEAEFTVIELRLDRKGVGEAKTSLSSPVVVDTAANTLALDRYDTAPILLKVTK